MYGSMKSIELATYDETDVMVSSRDAFFDSDFLFSEGLWYSFGITAYDGNREPVEDPSYGVLKPYYKTWGFGYEGFFQEIPTRPCTE